MKIRSLLSQEGVALIIGNGVNRHNNKDGTNSWEQMLSRLANAHLPTGALAKVPTGLSLTEYYDLLDLKSQDRRSAALLPKHFCEQLSSWKPKPQHEEITSWAREHAAPILTTNFDTTLSDAAGLTLRRHSKQSFTDFYPWESYFSEQPIYEPDVGFAIWHINGLSQYSRSIRLGLTHYMGSVQRARAWLHKNQDNIQFSGKNQRTWRGGDSWLHIIFNKPLLFFGIALEENEVFLRWLLIERARYFRQFPNRRKNAWYAHVGEPEDSGKLFFLRGVGITPIKVNSHEELYSSETWAH